MPEPNSRMLAMAQSPERTRLWHVHDWITSRQIAAVAGTSTSAEWSAEANPNRSEIASLC